jgi:hypothetical protein
MKSSMEAFEAKIKDLLAVAPTPEDYENLVEFKELIELGWRLCDQYHEGKSVVLREALEKILSSRTCKTHKLGECPSADENNLYIPAWKALKEYRGEL